MASRALRSSPLVRGAVAGRWQATTAGQPGSVGGGAVEYGALVQPASSMRQRLSSPGGECGVFMLELLDALVALGLQLAQLVEAGSQPGLGQAFALQLVLEVGDALLGLLPLLLGLGACGLVVPVLAPEQGGESGEQGEAEQALAQAAHAAWPQWQAAWRW